RAIACFQAVIEQVQGTEHDRWAEKASVCLALAQSHLGQRDAARATADAVYRSLFGDRPHENRGSAAYFIQILGQVYVNLAQFEVAESLFAKALSFSESSHYTQVQGKTLTGLAIMQRQRGEGTPAIATHQQAIALLERLGAKCDLAEAYYQLGLTHLQREDGQHKPAFETAIALFQSMSAPQQVAKVQRSAK
ncbi:MAG TPA: NB-ARC domain-containing protein, partial [Stenomitos sp.]